MDSTEAELLAPAAEIPVFWVTPDLHTWLVQRQGHSRPEGIFALQDDALDRARSLALRHAPSLVKVQDYSGRVIGEYNYGAIFLVQAEAG